MHGFISLVAVFALALPPAVVPSGALVAIAAPAAAGPKVAVLPLSVQGSLPDVWREEADARLRDGLSRGPLTVQRLEGSSCTSADCAGGQAQAAGADYGVWAQLTVAANQKDYAFVVKAVGADTSNVVATIEGTCDLCGFEEAVAMVEAKAASLPAAIERLSATNPVVAFTSTPDGVEIEVDGTPAGTTPLVLPLSPGKHRVQGTKAGYQPQTFEIEAVEGVRKELSFGLVELPSEVVPAGGATTSDDRSPRPLIIGGAVLTSVGLAGAVAGATLLALNGRSYQAGCDADPSGNCAFLYGTQTAGAIPTALGSAAFGAGVALLIVGTRRRGKGKRRADATARVRPGPGGFSLRF